MFLFIADGTVRDKSLAGYEGESGHSLSKGTSETYTHARGAKSQIISQIHRHLLDDRIVEFLYLIHHSLILIGDQIHRDTFATVASRASDAAKESILQRNRDHKTCR